MRYKIHRINTFSHPIFGTCVDVKCINSILKDNQFIHFIVPNDEFYLQPINFAFNLKAEWTPDINDYTIVRIPGDIRSLIPVISVHSVDGLMARS